LFDSRFFNEATTLYPSRSRVRTQPEHRIFARSLPAKKDLSIHHVNITPSIAALAANNMPSKRIRPAVDNGHLVTLPTYKDSLHRVEEAIFQDNISDRVSASPAFKSSSHILVSVRRNGAINCQSRGRVGEYQRELLCSSASVRKCQIVQIYRPSYQKHRGTAIPIIRGIDTIRRTPPSYNRVYNFKVICQSSGITTAENINQGPRLTVTLFIIKTRILDPEVEVHVIGSHPDETTSVIIKLPTGRIPKVTIQNVPSWLLSVNDSVSIVGIGVLQQRVVNQHCQRLRPTVKGRSDNVSP
jgi:hypothetical protein